ncbi:hypothetical protein [Asaia spathodeae]|uniref:Uncharacterized protein n=1 Tax=Asaia spathodeae TaxID=657016 RepID=A0ABX2P2E8_9PROT|nr:hypothetical protein [Asaia spathodeae]GBR14722.1 hypothetical protein AA105894_1152 [Asaia spathodeae NBRC 105894]
MGAFFKRPRYWRYALTDLGGLAFAAAWGMRGLAVLNWPLWICGTLLAAITLPLAWGFLTRDLALGRPEFVIDRVLAARTRRARVILLMVAGTMLSILHRPDLMLLVAGLVIGASYLPLGRAMKEPVHIGTGLAILLVTLFSLALPQPWHMLVAGLGTATSCWLGAALRLMKSLPPQAVRETAPEPVRAGAPDVQVLS